MIVVRVVHTRFKVGYVVRGWVMYRIVHTRCCQKVGKSSLYFC